jgi:hypothetical protein
VGHVVLLDNTRPSVLTADGIEAAELSQGKGLVMVVLPTATFGSGRGIGSGSAVEDLGCDRPLHDD